MVCLNILSQLFLTVSAVTAHNLFKRECTVTSVETAIAKFPIYGSPYTSAVLNTFTAPAASGSWSEEPIFSVYIPQQEYDFSGFSVENLDASGLTITGFSLYSGDIGNFVELSPAVYSVDGTSFDMFGKTTDPLLRIDIRCSTSSSQNTYVAVFRVLLNTVNALVKRDEATFDVTATITVGNGSGSASATSTDVGSSSSSTAFIATSSSSFVSATSTFAIAPASLTVTIPSSTVALTSTETLSKTEETTSSGFIAPLIATGSSVSSGAAGVTSNVTSASTGVTSGVTSASTGVTSGVTSASTGVSSGITFASTGVSSGVTFASTVSAKSTIIKTITSCSDNACSATTETAYVSDVTVTISGTQTVTETTCTLEPSVDAEKQTSTVLSTLTETITSCSDNICTLATQNAVVSEVVTTVSDRVTIYTTTCPISGETAKPITTYTKLRAHDSAVAQTVAIISTDKLIGGSTVAITATVPIHSGVAATTPVSTITAVISENGTSKTITSEVTLIASNVHVTSSISLSDNNLSTPVSESTTHSSTSADAVDTYTGGAAVARLNTGVFAVLFGLALL
ncbi:hypothetical protein DAMA08_008530 [Martiniozyma asiatica (nom. inval.)]|nr:hypothetical protein DAMA08_008530 [Martiniozyma asiatica]